ncbi:MAG: endolytic transglycosylase MltG [Saprospiraceae bacterium]|nr:endolytic transglycosylase MltG [Saprospiraceae bacterium]
MIRKLFIIGGAIVALLLVAGVIVYQKYLSAPTRTEPDDTVIVYVPTGANLEQVLDSLTSHNLVKDEAAFRYLAEQMQYAKSPMRSGRYRLDTDWNILQIVRHLRSGRQDPVKVILTTERMIEDVAAKVSRFIEPDSTELMATFTNDSLLTAIGYTRENLMSLFIPNTYECYWDMSAQEFVGRMIREHKKFWDQKDRTEKAKALGMTPQEVYTLASIVEKETLKNEEKPRIAGAYLNRLKINMRLQADPTLVFATRDFETRRVLNYHKEFVSPYNTYMNAGLPPGPIAMSSISSIDAVLNPEKHNYVYFCAVGDGSGLHAFAETLEGHNVNKARYLENLRKQGLID